MKRDDARLRSATFRGLIGLMGLVLGLAACQGQGRIFTDGNETPVGSEADSGGELGDDSRIVEPGESAGYPIGGIKRLSSAEVDRTLADIYDIESKLGERFVPDEGDNYFQNEFLAQQPSFRLAEDTQLMARELSMLVEARLRDSESYRLELLGAEPAGPDDEALYRDFLTKVGRKVLRRPITPEEEERFVATLFELKDVEAELVAESDFIDKIALTIEALTLHPEFIYRPENGRAVEEESGTVYVLDDWALASRLSFLLWGTAPDDWLLDQVEAGELASPAGVRKVAAQMMEDPRFAEQVHTFHDKWLGYAGASTRLPEGFEGLGGAMELETRALVERVVLEEKRDWREIFTFSETFVTAELAEHYELPSPDDPEGGWVSYDEEGMRAGIFSHGAFLTVGSNTNKENTSVIHRGVELRARLFCEKLFAVAVPDDHKPKEPLRDCRYDKVVAETEVGTCASCHHKINGLGYGLDNFDTTGRFREAEYEEGSFEINESCTFDEPGRLKSMVDGEWKVDHTFRGPRELGEIMVDDEIITHCAMTQLYEFTFGHEPRGKSLRPLAEGLFQRFKSLDYRFDEMILELVSSQEFRVRAPRPAP